MDELFEILKDNQKNYGENKKNDVALPTYKIDKSGIKNAHMKQPLKFGNKKIIAFGLGSIMFASGFSFLLKNDSDVVKNDSTETQSVSITTETVNNKKEESVPIKTKQDAKFKSANFEIGKNPNIEYIEKFRTTDDYLAFEKNSIQYGVDAQIMSAIGFMESSLDHDACLPGNWNYNGCAIGIMQLEETNIGKTITAKNYITGETDSIEYTLENIKDYDKNIQIACMMFQNSLEKYNGNLYLAIQAHNYGSDMIDLIVEKTAQDKNVDVDHIINYPFAIDWTNYLEDVHSNPLNYISSWDYETYGNPNYVYSVINCCTDNEAHYICGDKTINFDLRTGHSSESEISKGKIH